MLVQGHWEDAFAVRTTKPDHEKPEYLATQATEWNCMQVWVNFSVQRCWRNAFAPRKERGRGDSNLGAWALCQHETLILAMLAQGRW